MQPRIPHLYVSAAVYVCVCVYVESAFVFVSERLLGGGGVWAGAAVRDSPWAVPAAAAAPRVVAPAAVLSAATAAGGGSAVPNRQHINKRCDNIRHRVSIVPGKYLRMLGS